MGLGHDNRRDDYGRWPRPELTPTVETVVPIIAGTIFESIHQVTTNPARLNATQHGHTARRNMNCAAPDSVYRVAGIPVPCL
jgi:hypothetical protein